MVNAALARALETLDRRADDARALFENGAPNFADVRRPAALEPARDPLAIVPPDDAYLVVGDPARPQYSRDGQLALRNGVLTTADGTAVLGFPGSRTRGVPRPLQLEARDALLGRAYDARVDADGLFGYARTVVDPQTLEPSVERIIVGRIALARFPAGSVPERLDARHVRPPGGVAPLVGTPSDGTFGAVATRSRARGRIDPDAAIARLGEAYLTLDALGGAERARTAMARDAFALVK